MTGGHPRPPEERRNKDADGLVNDDDIVGRAVRHAGGRIVSGERIPHEMVVAAFDGLDD